MTLPANLAVMVAAAQSANRPLAEGRVRAIRGIAMHVAGLRAAIGDLCIVQVDAGRSQLPAEVVGFDGTDAVVLPLGDMHGVSPFDRVVNDHRSLSVPTGTALLGRVLDALGRPLDGGAELQGAHRSLNGRAPSPLERAPIDAPIETGTSAIDGFLTCGKGQRIGIFAGSGVGKSTLLGQIAKSNAGQINVICLIGERGREVGEFITDSLGREGMQKSVVIACTSDAAPMLRLKAPMTAVTIAEAFREQGRDVLFMMDSVTRFAMAAREVGLAAGEPPTLRGYPPSLFAMLPQLVERLGNDGRGSITGLLTVLVDGDDMNEPVADALRGYLDGHIVLSRRLAERGRYPAIDVLASISRLMPKVTTADHQKRVRKLREWLAHHEENRDLITVGAYKRGGDPLLDAAIGKMPAIEGLLYHGAAPRPAAETHKLLQQIAGL
ncbi:EscN/YscN/HrcN family type III secretion system ATPase [Planctomycetota bacterium]|nr:EscN/YscN/HrcN family type III secretion system ATPase [Planctomycetota bacterium]